MDATINLIAVLAIAGVGAFIGSYLRERGKNWATHEDLSKLIDQVRATTDAAEQIKRTIAREDWKEREWETLRRLKLEELLTLAQRCIDWSMELRQNACFAGSEPSAELDPLPQAASIAALYFPELRDIFQQFDRASHKCRVCCAEAAAALVGMPLDEPRLAVLKQHVPGIDAAIQDANYARVVVVAAAAVMVHQRFASGSFGSVIPVPPRNA